MRFLNEFEFAKIYIYFIKILQFENLGKKTQERNPEFLLFSANIGENWLPEMA